jgi:2-polyprenyl-3-methyl-5-hydroxy-6-metoxy-1,4-benzoquinol methylase
MGSVVETCVICGGALVPSVPQPRSSYGNGSYRIDACTACGAGTTLPRPTQEDLARCYEKTYGYTTHDLIEPEKRRRSASLLRWSGLTAGRVLDVGCMFGFLLDEAARRGLETFGVEPSAEAAAAAAAKGHTVVTGELADLVARHPGVRYDAIFAQHVLEHVPDPVGFLTTARGLLAPGGKVMLAVPNFDARLRRLAPSAWGWYQVPVHLVHYTPRALRALVERAGLHVVDERTRGGDTLFLGVFAAQLFGVSPGPTAASAAPPIARAALRLAGVATRPYFVLGDDELAIIAAA